MSKMKLKIGEFSQMMQVTVKTLRHYEQKGLLLPDEVDEWTGYRYYSLDQMQKLQSIRDLQRLGFSLDEIKDLYDDVSHTPSVRQLTEKIKKTEQLYSLRALAGGWACVMDFNWLQCISSLTPAFIAWCYYPSLKKHPERFTKGT